MKNRINKISLLIVSIYWIPSTLLLINIINAGGIDISDWLEVILWPGYFLGFALGFFSGGALAFVGQLITLAILFIIVRILVTTFIFKK